MLYSKTYSTSIAPMYCVNTCLLHKYVTYWERETELYWSIHLWLIHILTFQPFFFYFYKTNLTNKSFIGNDESCRDYKAIDITE